MTYEVKRGDFRELGSTLRGIAEEASRAHGFRAHIPVGQTEATHNIPIPAVRSALLSLKSTNIATIFDKEGRLRRTPGGKLAGETLQLDRAVILNSRVSWAGAVAMVMQDQSITDGVNNTGVVVTQRVPVEVRRVNAATFATVDIDAEGDAPLIALPVKSVRTEWDQGITKGVRFELKRSDMRGVDPDVLQAEIGASLALGLARAADRVLLDALQAATLPAYSIGAAAAQGLRFTNLRALVGTAGAGAGVAADGSLSAAGVAAELTPDMAGTIAGDWTSAGVAIRDEVSVHYQRLGVNGGLAVTAWAMFLPLLVDASRFWTVQE